jgi:glutamine cyclotransferase
MENRIVVINADTGIVENQLDVEHIVERVRQKGYQTHYDAVLNGIAFHKKTRTLIISGKLWPTLYHVKTALI